MPLSLSSSSTISELRDPVPHSFCDQCLELLTSPESKETFPHKKTYAHLENSVAEGCRLCYLFHKAWLQKLAIDPEGAESKARDVRRWDADEILRYAKTDKSERVKPMFSVAIKDTTGNGSWGRPRGRGDQRTDIEYVVFQCGLCYDRSYSVGCNLALVDGQAPKIAGRVIPKHADLDLAQKWIEHCVKNHPGCARPFCRELPKRIIDIGHKDGPLRPRLATSFNDNDSEYVALSHCWGDRQPLVTTTRNYDDHLHSIEWTALPKSFQDAITVVRWLGYRYLWIDSLCIIQDDVKDWREQCPKMVSIYSNATLTIAAAGARDAFEGFLHPRTTEDQSDLIYLEQPDGSGLAKIAVTPFIREFSGHGHSSCRAEYPDILAQRAWAFQERLLSHRVLYFGSEQMYFECHSGFFCESIRFPLQSRDMDRLMSIRLLRFNLNRDNIVPYRALWGWYRTIEGYSDLKLKYGHDRLPAIAGLAKAFQDRLGFRYYAGLWMEDMAIGLGWMRDQLRSYKNSAEKIERGDSKALDQQDFPSWSWASCNYPVRHQLGIAQADFQVITPTSDAIEGTCRGHLDVRGRMAAAIVSHDMLNDKTTIQSPHSQQLLAWEKLCLDHPDGDAPDDHLKQREALEIQLTKQVECLLLSEDHMGSRAILLLEAVHDDSTSTTKLYRRCGAYYASSSTEWLDEAPVHQITII